MKTGMRRGRVLGLALVLLAVLAESTCDDPTGVQLDIVGISSTDEDAVSHVRHFHRCTIPGRDITVAAPGDHEYTSTVEEGHSHTVILTAQQLLDLQQSNSSISVTSSSSHGHTHQFLFQH